MTTSTITPPLYLTRLLLNPRSRAAARDLDRPYELHRTLMSLFPAQEEKQGDFRLQQGVLHRVETDPATGAPSVLLQSEVEPNFDSLLARGEYLLPGRSASDVRTLPNLEEVLLPGRVFRFRLRANATRKIDTKSGPDGKRRNGKRVAVRGEEAQRAWLLRKAQQHGFALPVIARTGSPVYQITITNEPDRRGRGEKKTYFSSVLFEGRLSVADGGKMAEAVRCGIGSGKAFGFGLLSLAPG